MIFSTDFIDATQFLVPGNSPIEHDDLPENAQFYSLVGVLRVIGLGLPFVTRITNYLVCYSR